MAFVSKKPLKKEVQTQLNQQFIRTIVELRTVNGGKNFISELLTDTEQVMLAKRLMTIFMLAENISQYKISKILNVSSSTVARTAHLMNSGAFSHLVRICRKKKDREVLLRELEVIVRFGMPSMGKDRWGWLDELYK